MFDLLILNGRIVDGSGTPWYRADVGVQGDRIRAIGKLGHAESRQRLDAADKIIAPGFIDAHVHGDLALFADPLHEPAIRQGVTTYVIGQDGVAMAPGLPATLEHACRYTAGFSGKPPLGQTWSSMAEYLALFERRCAVNVACLIPNGNVRMDVLGLETRPPTAEELERMRRIVREAMEQGAIGLSSGLDYIPSRYAGTEELIELCKEIAPFGGVYVTHVRRYDPEGVLGSMDEVYRIGTEAGVAVHVSHFNSRADLVLPKLDSGRAAGIDVTFDLYCYLAGSSILAMVTLPPGLQEGGVDATVARLRNPAVRAELCRTYYGPLGGREAVRLSYVAAEQYRHLEGLTLPDAAAATGKELMEFVCDVLIASDLAVGCIAPHRNRNQEDVRR